MASSWRPLSLASWAACTVAINSSLLWASGAESFFSCKSRR